jgi:phosphoribosyl-AMP cyclohydrolase
MPAPHTVVEPKFLQYFMSDTPALQFGERADNQTVETALVFSPKFDANGLITTVAQDARSGEVLMVAYMNEESLRQTIEKGEAVYWSRSRKTLWHKGATSGHVQEVEAILTDCDQDALILRVRQKGPGCCHAGYRSCFYRRVDAGAGRNPIALAREIEERSYDPDEVYR